MIFTLADVQWAAEECERQRSGEMSVYQLIGALSYLRSAAVTLDGDSPSADTIRMLGHLIHPPNDLMYWRRMPVGVRSSDGEWEEMTPPESLDRTMTRLIDAWYTLDPDEWYHNFEETHPFIDGNGRAGSLLWNLHRGTLADLEHPPDFADPAGYWGH